MVFAIEHLIPLPFKMAETPKEIGSIQVEFTTLYIFHENILIMWGYVTMETLTTPTHLVVSLTGW